jgi:hypothetical protein
MSLNAHHHQRKWWLLGWPLPFTKEVTMSIPAILIGIALLLASIPIVAGPLYRQKRRKPTDEERTTPREQRGYKQILLALRDLDFDHQLGLVDEADYMQLRTTLLAEAAEAYEQKTPGKEDLEQFIEKAVRDRRQHIGNGQGRCANCGADLDLADKFCAACGFQARVACPHCNQPVAQGDNFCTFCGAPLAVATGVTV